MNVLDLLDPSSLNDIGTSFDAGGQFLSSINRFQYGSEQRQAMDFQAAQYRILASDSMGSAQRTAWSVDRQSKYIASAALASAAASGGGASDPTVVSLISKDAEEGAYRSAVALYEGQDKARQLSMNAQAKEYEGKILERQSDMTGMTGLMAGGASLLRGAARSNSIYQRFGSGGPTLDATPNRWG